MDTVKEEAYHFQVNKYLICFLLGIVVFWLTEYMWRKRDLFLYSWRIHGPTAYPVIGSTYMFWGDPSELMRVLLDMQNIWTDIIKVWFGFHLVFLVSKPEYVQKIFTNPYALNKDPMYEFIGDITGYGLLTAPTPKWKKHRKVISPSFKKNILDSFVDIFVKESTIMADQLMKFVGQANIDLYHLTSRCTMDIICQTAMGVNLHAQTTKGEFGAVIENLLEVVNYRLFRLWLHPTFIWRLHPVKREFEDSKQKLLDITDQVIQEKINGYEMDSDHSNSTSCDSERKYATRLTILDFLLETSDFTKKEMREEVLIFLTAGTETTASATSFIFTMLGMHQDIQQQVYEEVVSIMGIDRPVQASDLPRMKYTERVIKETLRIFPVGPFFARHLTENVDIGDFILPKYSSVAVNTIHIHRDPKYWNDPLKFDPDRFLPQEMAKRHPCCYLPFSYGPRNCIGARYAVMNLKTIVATIIRQFEVFTEYKSINEIDIKLQLLLRMTHGPKVRLELR